MKKIVSLFFVLVCVFSACKMDTEDDKTPQNEDVVLYSREITENTKYEIRYQKEVNDGITSEVVNYIITETTSGKKMGIAVNKTGTSQVNSVYKFGIMAGRKTESFPNLYWDSYIISLGQDTLLMDNDLATPATEGEYQVYVIAGGISHSKLQQLKAATLITVELKNTNDSSRNTSIPVHPNFQRALLSKMP